MHDHLRRARSLLIVGVLAALSLPGIALAYSTGAYGSGSYGSCVYGSACSISLTSSGTVNLNITPAIGGKCTIQSDTATVTTDDANGYTLTLADNTTNTSLLNGAATITATSGTPASPVALSGNVWGYRVDGLSGFGAGPTGSSSNVAPPVTTFAGVQSSSGTADTIANTSVPASAGANTVIWYGACAGSTAKSGSYSTQITYTAVAN
jgi:hypothetical protein